MLGLIFLLFLILPGCLRDEPQTSPAEQPSIGAATEGFTEWLSDSESDLDRVRKNLRDSPYPLTPITNPDPNQYGANGGGALRCGLVGVDLLYWTFDDGETARRAGELWEEEISLPLRWTVSKNVLLVIFTDDDFEGVSAEAAEELMAIFDRARED